VVRGVCAQKVELEVRGPEQQLKGYTTLWLGYTREQDPSTLLLCCRQCTIEEVWVDRLKARHEHVDILEKVRMSVYSQPHSQP
jgi:hypothetical protein